jgi:hypothetical protein
VDTTRKFLLGRSLYGIIVAQFCKLYIIMRVCVFVCVCVCVFLEVSIKNKATNFPFLGKTPSNVTGCYVFK